MAYGIGAWGIASWGGANFFIEDQFPIDGSTGNPRLTIISFLLHSGVNITLNTINVTANGVYLIFNGSFTIHASGAIDSTNPSQVQITMTVTQAFQPLENITIVVNTTNINNENVTAGSTWSFTVDNTIHLFNAYIVRRFQRVLLIGNNQGLSAPENPYVEVDLLAPPHLIGGII